MQVLVNILTLFDGDLIYSFSDMLIFM